MNDGSEAFTPLEPSELYDLHKLNKEGSARVFVKIQRGEGMEHGATYRAIHYIDIDASLKNVIVGHFDTLPPDEPIPYRIVEQPETD